MFSGHEQESLLRLQPLQTGLSSPQRFLRRLQVKQPVLTRVMGRDRGFFCTGMMTFEHSAAKQAVEVDHSSNNRQNSSRSGLERGGHVIARHV